MVAALESPSFYPFGSCIQPCGCTAIIPRVGKVCFPDGSDGTTSIRVVQQTCLRLHLEEGLLLREVGWLATSCSRAKASLRLILHKRRLPSKIAEVPAQMHVTASCSIYCAKCRPPLLSLVIEPRDSFHAEQVVSNMLFI